MVNLGDGPLLEASYGPVTYNPPISEPIPPDGPDGPSSLDTWDPFNLIPIIRQICGPLSCSDGSFEVILGALRRDD